MNPPEVIHAQADQDSYPDEARDRGPADEPLDVRLLRGGRPGGPAPGGHHCTLSCRRRRVRLLAGAAAVLVLHLPPQHLGEHAWQEQPPDVPGLTPHRAAGPSRLAFGLPEGSRIAFNLAGVLDALQSLALRVSPNATPAPTAATSRWPPGRGPSRPATTRQRSRRRTGWWSPRASAAGGGTRPSRSAPPGRTARAGSSCAVHLARKPPADGQDDVSDTEAEAQRIVRAIWTCDFEHGSLLDPAPPAAMSLNPFDRRAMVEQTYGAGRTPAPSPRCGCATLRSPASARSSTGARPGTTPPSTSSATGTSR